MAAGRPLYVAAAILVMGILTQAVAGWDSVGPDGVSYLTLASNGLRGDVRGLVNPLWSPGYPAAISAIWFLLGGEPGTASVAAHMINAAAALCIILFIFVWRRWDMNDGREPDAAATAFLLVVVGWVVLRLFTVSAVTPDMLFAVFASLACIRAIKVSREPTLRNATVLGVCLAACYATKSLGWYFAWAQLGALTLVARKGGKFRAPLVAACVFLIASLPVILEVSHKAGRLTTSDAGRYNLLYDLESIHAVFRGDAAHGVPTHPMRLVYAAPEVLEFGSPFDVPYARYFAASYWTQGVRPDPSVAQIVANASEVTGSLITETWPFLAGTIGLLLLSSARATARRLLEPESLLVLVPSFACLGLYFLAHFEGRYVAPFFLLVTAAVARALVIGERRQVGGFVMSAGMALLLLVPAALDTAHHARVAISGRETPARDVASAMTTSGIGRGEKVASLGRPDAYWAFLAGARIVAEVRHEPDQAFWSRTPAEKACAFVALASTGARAVVAMETPPPDEEGWQKLPAPFSVRMLSRPTEQELASCSVIRPLQPVR